MVPDIAPWTLQDSLALGRLSSLSRELLRARLGNLVNERILEKALELQPSGVRVNLVNPGAMRTDMRRAAYPDEDPATLREPASLVKVFLYLASEDSAGVTG